jgi:cytochrome c oxidase assembly protein subunit 15
MGRSFIPVGIYALQADFVCLGPVALFHFCLLHAMSSFARKIIGTWLLIGCVFVFLQTILGGITRLTESGLSITEWKPVKGTIPPLNTDEWNEEFGRYKQQTQYQVINSDMTVEEFKWIYFWEYLHRLNARLMGLAFLLPAAYFFYKSLTFNAAHPIFGTIPGPSFIEDGFINKKLAIHLALVFLMATLQGVVGWLMVKAGLKGLFVPPVRLTIHLIMALLLLAYLWWLTLYVYRGPGPYGKSSTGLKALGLSILAVLFLQIFFGGILSGMKAGLAYPSWPDMNREFIPSALFSEHATLAGFVSYLPQDLWGKAFIQFMHRMTAYTLVLLVAIFFFKSRNIATDKIFKTGLLLFPFFVLLQATIGVLTVLHCVGRIPLLWGVLHQAGAMFLIAETVFVIFHLTSNQESANT